MMSINNPKLSQRGQSNSDFADALKKAFEQKKSGSLENKRRPKGAKIKPRLQQNVRRIEKPKVNPKVKRGYEFTADDIMRTLNDKNQREGTVGEIFDDGVDLLVGKKFYFVPKDHFKKNMFSDLKSGELIAFELGGEGLSPLIKKIDQKKAKIEKKYIKKLKNGVYKGIISAYQDKKENNDERGYYVKIGNVGGKQDELFLSLSDMITGGSAKVGDLISLKIKDTEKTTEVEEFYLKPGDEFVLKSNNYNYINKKGKKPFIFVNMGVYKGIIKGEMLPKGFKNGDTLLPKVRFINQEKSENLRDGLPGMRLIFEDVKRNIKIKKNNDKKNFLKSEVSNKKKKEENIKSKNVA